MTDDRRGPDRPSLREVLSAAGAALAVGALIAWTTAPVAAAPVALTAPTAVDPFAASRTGGPAWIVTPRAARPGEVVHVRIRFTLSTDPASGQSNVPYVLFAFLNDLSHPVLGSVYPAEGTFGVDLVVPPGTDWGQDPIVWASTQSALLVIPPNRLLALASRNALIPFVASRSAQPPLWTR